MGVDRTDYIMVGYKMPYEVRVRNNQRLADIIYEDAELEEMSEESEKNELAIVLDGMSGNYIAFGKILQRADEYEGFKFCELGADIRPNFDEVYQSAKKLFEESDFDFSSPKCLVFSHYS